MIEIIYLLYGIIFFMLALMGIFIVYHIVRYSYNKINLIIMLLLFVVPFLVLMFTNFMIFSSLNLTKLFSFIK